MAIHPNRSKKQEFHVGQWVEAARHLAIDLEKTIWRKGKIISIGPLYAEPYVVAFDDRTTGAFKADHIRAD